MTTEAEANTRSSEWGRRAAEDQDRELYHERAGERGRADRHGPRRGFVSERMRCLTGLSEETGNLRTVAC